MSSIGVVILATNAYFILGIRFIKKFVYHYKGNDKVKFYFFSDRDPKQYLPDFIDCSWIQASNKRWVDGTNMKFTSILSLKEICKEDYIFYFDADTSVERDFTADWFLGELVGGQHYNDSGLRNEQREFERNPKYAGYIPLDSSLKQMYYYGAFFGGKTDKVYKFCEALVEMQHKDKALNYEPLHNDETYINAYFHYNPPDRIVMAPEFKFAISHKGGLQPGRMDFDISYYLKTFKTNKDNLLDLVYSKVVIGPKL